MAKKKKKKTKRKTKRQPVLTNAMVKAWGFECDNMTVAALRYKGSLVSRIHRSTKLQAAWDRGRFLRDIAAFAGAGATKAEVAIQLKIELAIFEEMLADPEAADIWVTAQNNAMLAIKMGIKDQAIAGKPAAIKSLTRIFENERPAGAVLDIFRVTMKQLEAIAQVSRETIHQWYSAKGLTRAGDNTFDLRQVWRWWELYSQRKVNVTPQVGAPDRLRSAKAIREEMGIDVERGKLLSRDEMVTGLVGRLQQFLELWDRMVDGVADKCSNMPKSGVLEILAKFKHELRGEFVKVEIEMKLTDSQRKKLESFLKELE